MDKKKKQKQKKTHAVKIKARDQPCVSVSLHSFMKLACAPSVWVHEQGQRGVGPGCVCGVSSAGP